MLEKSQEYLRLALAIAAVLVGLSVAYHYVIYIPEKDRAKTLQADTKANAESRTLQAKQTADAKAALDRRTNYRICLSAAQGDYSARWDESCRVRSVAADKNRADCIQKGIGDEYCASTYPPLPATDCSLARELSENYDSMLRENRKQCLEEARTGVLAPL